MSHPKRIQQHWNRVADMGCLISFGPAQIAHAHGPSLTARGFLKPKGKKQVWQDWLVLPLAPKWHHLLDNRTQTFEAQFGTCAMWLDLMCERLGYDVWEKSRAEMKPRMTA